MKKNNRERFDVRITSMDKELYSLLAERAEKNMRSVGKEILFILKNKINEV
jgi:hypothetical protein